MSDVASAFTSRRLEDVYWFQEGPGVRKWQFFTEGIKLLNVANIEKLGRLNLAKTDRHLSVDEATGKYAHFLLDEGDLVIASSGISFDEDGLLRTRGAFVEGMHLPLCLNTSTIRFKSKEGQSDLNFLRHWLNGLEFRTQITKLVTGSAQQNFGPTHLKALSIFIPPIEEQRRIAAILDQAETLRTQRRQALAHLDTLTQSLFLDMFGDPRSNPKGWRETPVGALTDCIVPGRDKPKSFSGGIPWVTTANLVHMGATLPLADALGLSQAEIDEVRAKIIPAGSVIISCVGDLGVVSLAGVPMVINQQLHSFQCGAELNNLFLMHSLSFQKAFMLAKASSTTLPYMNKSVCNSIPVVVPPLALQQTFATRIQAIEALKATHRAALAQLDALFASLQQRAFAGEL